MVYEEIMQAMMIFHMSHIGKAKRIYLGRSQVRKLKVWAIEFSVCTGRDHLEQNQRLKVSGLPVYLVDEESHLFIA